MKKVIFTFFASLFLLCSQSIYCQQQMPDNTTGRLWGLCKVWGYMQYYHPKICQVNWDSLVQAKIPMVINAASNAEYNTILLDMVEDLGQLTPSQATVADPVDSNLNLDVLWMQNDLFSPQLQAFLDTFSSRAGRNDSIASCYNSIFDLITAPTTLGVINYNNLETRLVLAFKYWNTYNYFSPYRDLIDQDWDTTLVHIIPELITGPSRKSFDLAMEKMNARTDDGHGFYRGSFSYFFTQKAMGIKIERIENKAVITKVHPGVTNINVGDIILEVNGEPIDQLTDSYRAHLAASNDAWFYRFAYSNVVLGPDIAQAVNLKLQNAQQEYTVALSRELAPDVWYDWSTEDPKPEWTILCNNYGYVNMNKLEPTNVAAMYQALKDQPAIVFDVRSYLKTSIWELAQYFMPQPIVATQFWSQTSTSPGRFNFFTDGNSLPPFDNPSYYPGKLYFLVDQNAISAAEYFVQYMQHAPDATVIGTQTAGADGNVISVSLTSNVRYGFTRLGTGYIDGYQCQRNGLRIDEPVPPTINGIRQGIDEMLLYVSGCNSVSTIDKTKNELSVQFYPNPVQQELHILVNAAVPEKLTINITDLTGRTLLSYKNQSSGKSAQLNVSTLVPGLYFINLQTSKGAQKTFKFVKE